MKFKYILIFFFIFSCAENTKIVNNKKIDLKKAFASKGFTLVYEDELYKQKIIKKKINDKSLNIIHSFLKQNTYVKIFNPKNLSKSKRSKPLLSLGLGLTIPIRRIPKKTGI